jgi:hypothetical protein
MNGAVAEHHHVSSSKRRTGMAKKKILMLVGGYAGDYEVMVPFQCLRARGLAS